MCVPLDVEAAAGEGGKNKPLLGPSFIVSLSWEFPSGEGENEPRLGPSSSLKGESPSGESPGPFSITGILPSLLLPVVAEKCLNTSAMTFLSA
jgi:hypothetical protein